jgi:peptidoglycan biosynthesis protein MviN/MurJ (putative lipid II flippase)
MLLFASPTCSRLFAEGAFSQAFVPVLAPAAQHGDEATWLIDRAARC